MNTIPFVSVTLFTQIQRYWDKKRNNRDNFSISFVAIDFGSTFMSNDTRLAPSSQMTFPASSNQSPHYIPDEIPFVTELEAASSFFSNGPSWQDLSTAQGFYQLYTLVQFP